jgi:hypothetical protein
MPEPFLRRVLRRVGLGRDESIEALTAAVKELVEAQRNQAAQLKRLVETQKAQDHRWQETFDRWKKDALESSRKVEHDAARTDAKVQKGWQDTFASMQKRWQEELEALQRGDKNQRKWRIIFARQMDAMMRAVQLSRTPLVPPLDLLTRRFRLFSQNEEDGIVLALFEHAGVTDRRFVEIGSGMSGGNSAILAYECGWSGLMIEIEQRKIDTLRENFRHNPGVVGIAAAVSPENINQLLSEHGFTGEIDLLSLDIDSFDYWVLEALTVVSPRVLIVEYNARLGPDAAVTIPKDGVLEDIPKALRGASLAALEKLARRKGYRLVLCEPTGTNAFFLRDGVATEIAGLSAAAAYRPAADRWNLEGVPEAADRVSLGTESLPLVEV